MYALPLFTYYYSMIKKDKPLFSSNPNQPIFQIKSQTDNYHMRHESMPTDQDLLLIGIQLLMRITHGVCLEKTQLENVNAILTLTVHTIAGKPACYSNFLSTTQSSYPV